MRRGRVMSGVIVPEVLLSTWIRIDLVLGWGEAVASWESQSVDLIERD